MNSGALGERAAARELRKKGYRLLAVNFRCRFGEIDIIAQNEKYICFVEVKTRREDSFFEAREAVTAEKQTKLCKAAGYYLAYHKAEENFRFDVMEVVIKASDTFSVLKINHIENAFESR